MDIFRRIFRFHSNNGNNQGKYRNESFNETDQDEMDDHFFTKSFEVFTNPFEMHQYFEHQMNEVLKIFGMDELKHFSFNVPNVPTMEESTDTNSTDFRDQFLKQGYEKPKANIADMLDKDLDERVENGNLDSILNEKPQEQLIPFKQEPHFRNYHYSHGSSKNFKTISRSDGSYETHLIVKDTEGNEESTVCHKMGEKEYCIIKKKDKEGKVETTEQLINMTEEEKDFLFKRKNTANALDNGISWEKLFK